MIRKGTKVCWKWGDGHATGEVEEIHTSEVTKTIDGNEIKRGASENEPAYLIRQEDGQRVLKSASEVVRADG